MIIVATHNGRSNLARLLASFDAHGTDGAAVYIAVSADSDQDFHLQVNAWCAEERPYVLRSFICCNNGFEAGSLFEAYDLQPHVHGYLLLQDSVEITGPGWYRQFVDAAGALDRVCVPWITFEPWLLGTEPAVKDRILRVYGSDREPGFGIFGSMFYATRAALEAVKEAGYFGYVAKDKIDSEAFERWWSLFFARLGIPIIPLHPNGYHHIHSGEHHFPLLRKYFARHHREAR